MRGLLLLTVAAFTVTSAAPGQAILGTYTTQNPGGATITLVLQRDAQGKIGGSMSGNGVQFTVAGQLQGDDVAGTLRDKSNGGAFFEAHREGAQLRLILADAGGDGKPDYAHARELIFVARSSGAAAGNSPAGAAGPTASSSTGAAGQSRGATAQDQQLIAFLTRNAWCTFSFSGGSTYTGGSYGNSNSSRTVFRPDGIAVETTGHELTNSGAPGNVYANGNGGQQVRWKVENATLMISADGVQWAPQQLNITQNSNGSPIVKSGGKEYMVCK